MGSGSQGLASGSSSGSGLGSGTGLWLRSRAMVTTRLERSRLAQAQGEYYGAYGPRVSLGVVRA